MTIKTAIKVRKSTMEDFKGFTDAQALKCYGISKQSMIDLRQQAHGDSITSVLMLAMSILSDAQCALEYSDDKEMARKFMNKSKHLISDVMQTVLETQYET